MAGFSVRTACLSIAITYAIAFAAYPRATASGEPNIVEAKVHGPSLEGNLLKDSPDRPVTVYLPPRYAETDRRYPVVYLLHGYTVTNRIFVEDTHGLDIHIGRICDKLISAGKIQPMIIVAPDCCNRYKGSFYTNSSVTGNWEDFVAQDLVAFVDKNFRTVASPMSRGIAGYSMGGYGAINIGVKNHGRFSAIYASGSVPLIFEGYAKKKAPAKLMSLRDFDAGNFRVQASYAQAAAFAPNPKTPPMFVDFPCNDDGSVNEAVLERWMLHDPCRSARVHRQTLAKQRLYIVCGIHDSLIKGNRQFVSVLQSLNIPHIYEEFDGGHTDRVKQRLETVVFPFFSRALEPDSSSKN